MVIKDKHLDPYFIRVDDTSYILSETTQGKDKEGSPKEFINVIGYFHTLSNCLARATTLVTIKKNKNKVVELTDYVKQLEDRFNNLTKTIQY